ncbi:MAG: hypothetical protein JWN94_4214 [Betaproteobacteria bacterium]|nr:hypothetical protein [Betaproteobacteria bacterium]
MNETPHRLEQVSFYKVESPLLAFGKNVVSQCGEDGIIERIFEIVKPANQYCVEFGAWDGKYLSNCWNLVTNRDWEGCFIEGNANKFESLLKTYSQNANVCCLNRFVGLDGESSLDNILSEIHAPENPDFVSIDVDGTDYFIWESLVKHRPRVLVIEFNPTVPNDVIFVQEKSFEVNQGCSLLALIVLGQEKGYELVCCTRWNAFFVEKALYPAFNIPNNFINNLYRPESDGRIFHGYDSHIYVTGMPQLRWSGVKLGHSDLQLVPPAEQQFSDAQKR